MRDSQRSRVYDAEHDFRLYCQGQYPRKRNATGYLTEQRFKNLKQIQKYVDNVLTIPYTRRYVRQPLIVRSRRGHVWAEYHRGKYFGTLRIPVQPQGWAMRETVVLHELAHHLTRSEKYAGHGPEFCKRFLLLIELMMGLDARNKLYECMIDHKVKIQP